MIFYLTMTSLSMSFVSLLQTIKFLHLHDIVDAPEKFKDSPVGLQLVARPQEDEALLGMGEIVDKALTSYKASM